MPDVKPAPRSTLGARLAKLGLHRDIDLVLHLPMRYEDQTICVPIEHAIKRSGDVLQIEGVITDAQVQYRPRRQLVITVSNQLNEEVAKEVTTKVFNKPAQIILRFLNFYGSQVSQLKVGERIRAHGEIRGGFWGAEIVHPTYRLVNIDTPLPTALTPIYPSGEGISQTALRNAIQAALKRNDWQDTLPTDLLAQFKLMTFEQSLNFLHHPDPSVALESLIERTHPAWVRMKFDELLAQQLSLQQAQQARRSQQGIPLSRVAQYSDALLHALPFQLTQAQQRVLCEIRADLQAPHPMHRLLQGDVGSGKTVIAALAAAQALDNGYQVALMAPTEILAQQHIYKIADWMQTVGVQIIWLTGRLTKKQKAIAYEKIQGGVAQLVIGTHALLQEEVSFTRLGLVIIDEQHRFGVQQRLVLRNKGTSKTTTQLLKLPHQLMMSATPIPRTLAMTYYADLEVSTIDELPPGRIPISTRLVEQQRRQEVMQRLNNVVQQGAQAYWVCPLIEESETLQLQTATDTYHALSTALPHLKIALLHGRLKPVDKELIMQRFVQGEIHVLVATTVIEVGVDVPNASLMVIEHAERFGLAQLHQLRGRVGRGSQSSSCILLYQAPLGLTAKQRLMTMYETQDGFEIARRDLQIRGPGEFLGARQSGQAMLRFANLEQDQILVEQTRHLAAQLLHIAPDVAQAHLMRWMAGREDFLKA